MNNAYLILLGVVVLISGVVVAEAFVYAPRRARHRAAPESIRVLRERSARVSVEAQEVLDALNEAVRTFRRRLAEFEAHADQAVDVANDRRPLDVRDLDGGDAA